MNNIAYSKRNVLFIMIRKLRQGFFKAWRIINQKIFFVSNNRIIKKIIIFTNVKDRDQLADILNRIMWAFPERKDLSIDIIVDNKLTKIKFEELQTPKNQYSFIKNVSHIRLLHKAGLLDILKKDLIISTQFLHPIFAYLPYLAAKLEIADPYFYAWTEGNVWMKKYFYTLPKKDKKYFHDLSERNYSQLINDYKGVTKSYCFLTGPTFSDYNKFSFEDESIKIICNSIIRDEQFLQYIKKPDILMFADCVFHYGPSIYAGKFRERAIEVIQEYGCYLIVPTLTVPLLVARYPSIEDHIIGLGISTTFNFPSPNHLNVYGTKSIVHYFMLPIASSLTDNIFFLGADGRKPDENYFWKHNPKVQFTDLMETVFNTHPSFFRDRIYSSDYTEYCKIFEKLIKFGESKGKNYYSLTKSHIPALAERLSEPNNNLIV